MAFRFSLSLIPPFLRFITSKTYKNVFLRIDCNFESNAFKTAKSSMATFTKTVVKMLKYLNRCSLSTFYKLLNDQ